MSEEIIEKIEAKQEVNEKPIIAGIGKNVSLTQHNPSPVQVAEQKAVEVEKKLANIDEEGKEIVKEVTEKVTKTEEVGLSDDELKELYEKRFSKPSEPSQEELDLKNREAENKRLFLFIENGGTAEAYSKLKELSEATDLKEISKGVLVKELKEKGYDEEFINEVLIERYYQINPDELEQGIEEDDDEFEVRKEKVKKKVELGTEALSSRSKGLKESAKHIFENLDKAISDKESLAAEEIKFIAKIDEISKTLPRKMTLSLGKLNNEDLGSVEVDVPEEEITAISDLFKNAERREQLLYNKDGEVNVEGLSQILLKNNILERAARESLLNGRKSQIESLSKVFPFSSPQQIGVGGNNSNPKSGEGKVIGFGKVQKNVKR